MRVAVVFWQLEPAGGGVYTFAGSVYGALRAAEAASGHEFVYYVAAAAGGRTPPGVLTIPYTRRERYRRAATYAWRDVLDRAGFPRRPLRTWFERSLAEQRIDLVWFATNYAEDCDLPYVLTIFDVEHVRQPWFPEVSREGEWERRHAYYSRYLPKASRVIAPNTAGRDQLERFFSVDPARVLCLPHPTPAFALDAAARSPAPQARVERMGLERPYLLYPAQFWAHKNHPTLLDAIAALQADGGEPYDLALVGSDKGGLEHVRRLARAAGLHDAVRFLGFVDTDDLVALYQHAHALTYASHFGPENLPPLEAFALGCPVVAADVPGTWEQLGDAAILVSPTDGAAFAAAARRLEDAALREELVAKGRDRAATTSAAGYVRGVLDFLDEFEGVRRCWA